MIPNADIAMKEVLPVLTDQKGGAVLDLSSWQGNEWLELMSFRSKVGPEKPEMKMPVAWSTIEGVREQLEKAGFRDIDARTTESVMPFDDYDEIARYILTQFSIMNNMTAAMTTEEMGKVRDLMVQDIKAKHLFVLGRLRGTAIIGKSRK